MTTLQRSIYVAGLMAASLVAGAVGMKFLSPKPPNLHHHEADDSALNQESEPSESGSVAVTIKPKKDESLTISVHNLGTVEAFFQTDLRARASGIVRLISKDIGDRVERGDLLLSIDVPDLEQEVFQKEALVVQRRQEVRVAESKRDDAIAALAVGQTQVRQRQTEVESAHATADFRLKRLERFRTLLGRDAVTPDVIEEQERDAQAATAALAGARVAVEKAEADLNEMRSAIETAKAEVALRLSMVAVADRDVDRARALADYARIRAPFEGVVVRRNVDPGNFVQNATSGTSETLISVARTDLITIVTKMPENVAPFLSRATEATMEFDDLPGVTFSANLSRFSPAIQTSDRTVRVEVDLFNGGQADYSRFVAKELAAAVLPLTATGAFSSTCNNVTAREFALGNRKGTTDCLPPLPMMTGASAREVRLFPGMTGTIRLQLRRFSDALVIPATSIVNRGGKSYLLEVRDGVTQLVPITVQVTDGKVAKVAVISRVPDARGGSREVLRELTGQEEIVASRQQEYAPGKPVKTAPTTW